MQDAAAKARRLRELVVDVQRVEVTDEFRAAVEVGNGNVDRRTKRVSDTELGKAAADDRGRTARPPSPN